MQYDGLQGHGVSETNPQPQQGRRNLRRAVKGVIPFGADAMRVFRTLVFGIFALAVAVAMTVYFLGGPMPPQRIALAGRMPNSIFDVYMRAYASNLAQSGVEVELPVTMGAVQNFELLRDPNSGVVAALGVVGAHKPSDEAQLASLGGMFYAPIFLVMRKEAPFQTFADLRGRRVSVGASGYLSTSFVLRMLQHAGIDATNSRLMEIDASRVIGALVSGEVEAAFVPGLFDRPEVRDAFSHPALKVVSLPHADAIAKLVPELHRVTLPRGYLNLGVDMPPYEIVTVAGVIGMTVRRDLHPGIQYLLLKAATEIHSPVGVFNALDEFPKRVSNDLPLSEEATRFYRSGVPWLQNYVGFWMGVYLERAVTLAVPLIAIVGPVARIAPILFLAYYRRKLRVWRWRLRELAKTIQDSDDKSSVAGPANKLFDEIEGYRFPTQLYREVDCVLDEVDRLRVMLNGVEARVARSKAGSA